MVIFHSYVSLPEGSLLEKKRYNMAKPCETHSYLLVRYSMCFKEKIHGTLIFQWTSTMSCGNLQAPCFLLPDPLPVAIRLLFWGKPWQHPPIESP